MVVACLRVSLVQRLLWQRALNYKGPWLGGRPTIAGFLDAGSVDIFLLSPAAWRWVRGAVWPWFMTSSWIWYSSLMTFLMYGSKLMLNGRNVLISRTVIFFFRDKRASSWKVEKLSHVRSRKIFQAKQSRKTKWNNATAFSHKSFIVWIKLSVIMFRTQTNIFIIKCYKIIGTQLTLFNSNVKRIAQDIFQPYKM